MRNLQAFLLATVDADRPFGLSVAEILPNNAKFSTGNRKATQGHISEQKHIVQPCTTYFLKHVECKT